MNDFFNSILAPLIVTIIVRIFDYWLANHHKHKKDN